MESNKLLKELKRTVDELQVFNEIGKTLTSTLDIKEVLKIIMQKVNELLKPSSFELLLTDDTRGVLKYEITIGSTKSETLEEIIRPGEGLIGWVAYEGKPLLFPDPTKTLKYSLPQHISPEESENSLICVPLKSKGKTLGVMKLVSETGIGRIFTEDDLKTIHTIADYSAIAIENARNFQRVQELTITDDMTSLYNSRYLLTLLDSEILRAKRYKKQFSMIFLDLDKFKEVNDTHGHIYGSSLLRETGQLIKRCLRNVDIATRYGGDEFVVILPETSKEHAVMVAERLRDAISKHLFLTERGLSIKFTASFGVATFPDDAESKEELIKMADEAMYRIKNSTRNGVGY
jgi:diguanylate cyclase (GGDEF)-like protein